jgi:hypothetical protein
MGQSILREVADGEQGGLDDTARVWLVEPGQHLEQGRLAGPVRAAEPDAVAITNLPGDVIEEDAIAEGFGEI